MKRIKSLSVVVVSVALLASALMPEAAQAFSINAFGGKYFGNNENVAVAGELTFGLLPMIDLGVFYEHSGNSYNVTTVLQNSESRSFYGGVGRFTLPVLPFFADLRIGPHSISTTTIVGSTSETGFTTQLGIGYNFGLVPGLSLMPRVGVQLADSNSDYPTWNGSIGLSLSL